MFDVLWTDPNRELVRDRMVRKEQEAKDKEKDKKQKSEHRRESTSTNSSSSTDHGFGIFASKSLRKTPTPSKTKDLATSLASLTTDDKRKTPTPFKTMDLATSLASLTTNDKKVNRTSKYGVKSLLSHQDGSEVTVKPTEGTHLPVQLPEAGDAISTLSSRDSILSKWTQPSAAPNVTGVGTSAMDPADTPDSDHLIQILGPSSFITRATEVTFAPYNPETDIDQLVSEVHISADRTKAETPPMPKMPEMPEKGEPLSFYDPSIMPSSQSPQTPPPIELPANATMSTPGWNSNDRIGNPDAWKPPNEWNCTPTKENTFPSHEEKPHTPPSDETDQSIFPGLVALQREVRMMAAASPELRLANIKFDMGSASDASVYKELEMTKKRWMFSVLQREGYGSLGERLNTPPGSPDPSKPSKSPKILALYETQASASFLAALHPQASVSHLSPKPISPNLFPNVHPILVPAVSASAGSRSLAPQLYSAVSCLPMPALFPSSEIPLLLRHIHRCLVPGGALYLTVMDPQPVSSTMGPKLRQWLFENLLIQIERECRTTYPSGTFPAWLAVAGLRAFGSTICTIATHAVPERVIATDGTKNRPSVESELRSLIGRMLWQEVWGKFVHAEKWWWEEKEIIEECTELGTYWQYCHIVAVKGKQQLP
ncbi:hypothetical protein F5B20DRAFT_581402 [Whalleya microplaca]|nr:hypothetical protein F5B20DRAFT_581402 [Whalleya microplaca]